MSAWSTGEVLALSSFRTGGNDRARRVWLGHAPLVGTGGRPCEGADVAVFKRFIVETYENRRYYKNEGETEEEERHDGHHHNTNSDRPVAVHVAPVATRALSSRATVTAPTPVPPDLLDLFGDATPAPNASVVAPTSVSMSPADDPFFDPFGGSVVAMPQLSTTTTTMKSHAVNVSGPDDGGSKMFDPFGDEMGNVVASAQAAPVTTNASTSFSASSTSAMNDVTMNTHSIANHSCMPMMNDSMNGLGAGIDKISMAMSGLDVGIGNVGMKITNGGAGRGEGMMPLSHHGTSPASSLTMSQHHRQLQYQMQQQQMLMMNANAMMMMRTRMQQPQLPLQHSPLLNSGMMDWRSTSNSIANNNLLRTTSVWPPAVMNPVGGMGWASSTSAVTANSGELFSGNIPNANATTTAAAANNQSGTENKPDPFAGLGF